LPHGRLHRLVAFGKRDNDGSCHLPSSDQEIHIT
jgi:hypothetical protein